MKTARVIPTLIGRLTLIAATCLVATAAAATPAEDAERAALSRERATIDSTYSARLADCQARFVVTSCVEDAKRDRRQGLDALRARQLVLDEQRRKERSSARRSELSLNAAEQARRDAARAERPAGAASQASAGRDASSHPVEPRRPAATDRSAPPSKPRKSAGTAAAPTSKSPTASNDRATKEARARATFDLRQQRAAEHREDAERSAAKRATQRPPAAPLPIPAGAKPTP